MAKTLYHSGGDGLHLGACWTDEEWAAEAYRDDPVNVSVDLSQLVVIEAPGYNRDEDWAPGDTPKDIKKWGKLADVIEYDDESPNGEFHRTWRLVSEQAVQAFEEAMQESA